MRDEFTAFTDNSLPITHDLSIGFAQFSNLAHHELADLFVGAHVIFLRDKLGQIELRTEVNPDLRAAKPVPQNLSGKIISEAGNEHRNYLWVGFFD